MATGTNSIGANDLLAGQDSVFDNSLTISLEDDSGTETGGKSVSDNGRKRSATTHDIQKADPKTKRAANIERLMQQAEAIARSANEPLNIVTGQEMAVKEAALVLLKEFGNEDIRVRARILRRFANTPMEAVIWVSGGPDYRKIVFEEEEDKYAAESYIPTR